jgi:O-antigen ligase
MLLLVIVIGAPQERIAALAPLRIALLTAGLAVAAHVYDRFKHRRSIVALPTELRSVGLLLAWAVATLPLSIWPGGSVAFLLETYLKTLVVFWLLGATADTPARVLGAARVMTALGIPLALTAIANFASGVVWDEKSAVERIVGYEGGMSKNPNDLALVLTLLLPLAVSLAQQGGSRALRLLFLACVPLFAAGVIVTFSRGGFVTLAAIFALYLLSFLRRGRWKAALGCLVLAGAILAAFPEGYSSRLSTIVEMDEDPTGSAQARWTDTVAALRHVREHPIVGAGIGMNILALDALRGETGKNVHNVYLQYAVELGLPGLGLFLWLYASCLLAVRRVARAGEGRELRSLRLLAEGILVSLLAFSISSLFHPVAYQFFFYLVAGLAVALGSVGRRLLAPPAPPRAEAARPGELWWQSVPGGGAAS